MKNEKNGTGGERLQKVLAQTGIASRRQAEEYIIKGRVTVNGKVATLGQKVLPDDQIAFDGNPLAQKEEFAYYFLYKPVKVITSAKDPQGRKTVLDLVKDVSARIYPVGRLDYDTSGVLLLTNDGELAYRLTHPKYEVDKTYRVWTDRKLPPEILSKLSKGILLEDGPTAPAQVKSLAFPANTSPCVEIMIHEGRNRQVRRMFEAVGFPVVRLERIRFGPVMLFDSMKPGEYRKLTIKEIEALRQLTDLTLGRGSRPGD